jgi:hypothetical protein
LWNREAICGFLCSEKYELLMTICLHTHKQSCYTVTDHSENRSQMHRTPTTPFTDPSMSICA